MREIDDLKQKYAGIKQKIRKFYWLCYPSDDAYRQPIWSGKPIAGFSRFRSSCGIERGIEKGIAKGINTGELIGEIRATQKFLKRPIMTIAELSQKSRRELVTLLQQLEADLN